MKLIKCHIEGFGKITSFDYTFNDKLNIIFEENGWGKTTFSVFIKSIFYGMSATRKKNLDENDRVLYTPIGGGKFGGYIEFENDGKIFRLERYFGKNEASDSELLTELSSGKTYNESNFKWGERLFGVNSDAFLRTLFLSQKDLDLSDNKCISDIIGEISSEESDINIERALKSIDEKVKDLKTTGGRGKIEEKKRQIVSVENEIITDGNDYSDADNDDIEPAIDLMPLPELMPPPPVESMPQLTRKQDFAPNKEQHSIANDNPQALTDVVRENKAVAEVVDLFSGMVIDIHQ